MASRIINMTIPEALIKEADKVAKIEGRTRSELFREAVRRYVKSVIPLRRKDSSGLLASLEALSSEGSNISADDIDKFLYRKDW